MKLSTVILLIISLLVVSCKLIPQKKNGSSTTGWSYNDPKNGGFEYNANYNQQTGPGLYSFREVLFQWVELSRTSCMKVTMQSEG